MYPLLETVDSVVMELFPYLRETLRPQNMPTTVACACSPTAAGEVEARIQDQSGVHSKGTPQGGGRSEREGRRETRTKMSPFGSSVGFWFGLVCLGFVFVCLVQALCREGCFACLFQRQGLMLQPRLARCSLHTRWPEQSCFSLPCRGYRHDAPHPTSNFSRIVFSIRGSVAVPFLWLVLVALKSYPLNWFGPY